MTKLKREAAQKPQATTFGVFYDTEHNTNRVGYIDRLTRDGRAVVSWPSKTHARRWWSQPKADERYTYLRAADAPEVNAAIAFVGQQPPALTAAQDAHRKTLTAI